MNVLENKDILHWIVAAHMFIWCPHVTGEKRKKDWKVYCCTFTILQWAITMPSTLHAFLILVKICIHTYICIYIHISYIRIHISYIFNSQTNPTVILILMVRKLRHREGKELIQGPSTRMWWRKLQIWAAPDLALSYYPEPPCSSAEQQLRG